jgi:hypothetical protein
MITPEKALVRSIKQYLTILQTNGTLTFNRITTTGKIYGNAAKQRFIPNSDMIGFSDFEILCRGKVGYLEVKAKRGKLSQAQIDFLKLKSKHGGKAGVARSLDDAIVFVRELTQGDVSCLNLRI